MTRKNDETTMIDRNLGMRIQELRIAMGLSRLQLANKIDVTHQQLQKYERGTNRIAAGRLVVICRALGKKVGELLDEIENQENIPSQHKRLGIEISRNFMKIKSPLNQIAVAQLVNTLARNS